MKIMIAVLCLSILCGCSPAPEATTSTDQAIDVTKDPVQINSRGESFTVVKGDYTFVIQPMAEYEIQAQIKSKRNYSNDWNALLAPVDLALAWGGLTSAQVKNHITYSQSSRWYYYRYDGQSPYKKQYIKTHSSNHHILPATDNIKYALYALRTQEHIRLKGFLVQVKGTTSAGKSVWWNSSMTRHDEGNNACEVLWVTELQVKQNIYR